MAIFSGRVQSYYLSVWSKAANVTFGAAYYNFVPLIG